MKLSNKIISESIKVLIIAAILCSIGGLGLKLVQEKIILILPLLIVIPMLNNLIGDFGIIIVSKFTTALYQKKIKKGVYKSKLVKHLLKNILPISFIIALYMSILAIIVPYLKGFVYRPEILIKIISVIVFSTVLIVLIMFFIGISGSLYIYKKNENPDDVLIPVITSVGDFLAMVIFSILVFIMF
jgi:cation transporter-like permease